MGERKRKWQRWTQGEARAVLAELESSEERIERFAARRGISTQRLRYWRKRLGEATTFVAVPLGDVPAARHVEIAVEGVVVRVREDMDVDRVARLAIALARQARC